MATNNSIIGIYAGGEGALSTVRITGLAIFNNTAGGMQVPSNGSILSFSNNYNADPGGTSGTIAQQ